MPTKNALRREKFQRINADLYPSAQQLAWLDRTGALLSPQPVPVDDPDLTSHLYGPAMKTVQMQHVRFTEIPKTPSGEFAEYSLVMSASAN